MQNITGGFSFTKAQTNKKKNELAVMVEQHYALKLEAYMIRAIGSCIFAQTKYAIPFINLLVLMRTAIEIESVC